MKVNKGFDVDVCNTIAVRKAERLLTKMAANTLEAAPGERTVASVDERDAPGFDIPVMDFHRIVRCIECDIRHVEKVVCEVFLDDVALISAADHKFIDPVVGVDFHDVPQDRLAADFNHRFGFEVGLLGYSSADSTSENYGLHLFFDVRFE